MPYPDKLINYQSIARYINLFLELSGIESQYLQHIQREVLQQAKPMILDFFTRN